MDLIKSIILGIVEGLTEFLPVSSTGHLILVEHALGLHADQPPWNALLWISQFAAILAVVLYFWRDLWHRSVAPFRAAGHAGAPTARPALTTILKQHILVKLFVAMVPTVVLALAFKKLLDPLESMPVAVAIALIAGAAVMELIDRRYRRTVPQELEHVTLRQAFLIGIIQCISMVPGVSRAGATIMGGMALGLTPRVATEFSFYLAIPTMLGAALKTTWKYRHELGSANLALMLAGCAASFVVALLVVELFLGYVRRYRFTAFAIYRVILGAGVLVYYFLAR